MGRSLWVAVAADLGMEGIADKVEVGKTCSKELGRSEWEIGRS